MHKLFDYTHLYTYDYYSVFEPNHISNINAIIRLVYNIKKIITIVIKIMNKCLKYFYLFIFILYCQAQATYFGWEGVYKQTHK